MRFDKLATAGYVKTSEATGFPPNDGAYNCIAWAADDKNHGFWWPGDDTFWLPWLSREETIQAFVTAFGWLGYRVCDNSHLETGYEKVVLYALHFSGVPVPPPMKSQWGEWAPKHMARQLSDGAWTSKCGPSEDLTHFTLDALESYGRPPFPWPGWKSEYGAPIVYMRRPKMIGWCVRKIQALLWIVEERSGRA